MEKVHTKESLAEKAHRTMAAQGLSEIYATEDGQLFYDKNRAELHAEGNKLQVFSYSENKKNKTKNKE